jgi:hypothetical protein
MNFHSSGLWDSSNEYFKGKLLCLGLHTDWLGLLWAQVTLLDNQRWEPSVHRVKPPTAFTFQVLVPLWAPRSPLLRSHSEPSREKSCACLIVSSDLFTVLNTGSWSQHQKFYCRYGWKGDLAVGWGADNCVQQCLLSFFSPQWLLSPR